MNSCLSDRWRRGKWLRCFVCAPVLVGVCLYASVRQPSHTKTDPRCSNNSFNKAPWVASSPLTLPRWTLCSTEPSVLLTVTCWMSNRKHRQAAVLPAVQRIFESAAFGASLHNIYDTIHVQRAGQNNGYTLTQNSMTKPSPQKREAELK